VKRGLLRGDRNRFSPRRQDRREENLQEGFACGLFLAIFAPWRETGFIAWGEKTVSRQGAEIAEKKIFQEGFALRSSLGVLCALARNAVFGKLRG
jgi:hypothetical protein